MKHHRSFIPWLLAAAWLLAGPAHAGEPNTLTKKEKEAGWRLLFDGKTTEGWRSYHKGYNHDAGWKVIDGALTRAQGGAGDIMTKDQFSSYELSLEYKIAQGGNSGLMFHVQEGLRAPYQSGPEIQIQDNEEGRDPQKSGWLYQFYSSEKDATKPAGQWNQLRLLLTPDQGAVWMNGVKYYDFVYQSEDWNQRLKRTKFADWPHFGKATRGHICLQDHGDEVAFRNIKIREID